MLSFQNIYESLNTFSLSIVCDKQTFTAIIHRTKVTQQNFKKLQSEPLTHLKRKTENDIWLILRVPYEEIVTLSF